MFAQGKQAMMFEGIWAYDTISQIAPDMEVGLFALPITDDAADVVLNMGDVTDAKRAQIEDIVKRKTKVSAENIVITPISTGTKGE